MTIYLLKRHFFLMTITMFFAMRHGIYMLMKIQEEKD